jgi:hypothetical protein
MVSVFSYVDDIMSLTNIEPAKQIYSENGFPALIIRIILARDRASSDLH